MGWWMGAWTELDVQIPYFLPLWGNGRGGVVGYHVAFTQPRSRIRIPPFVRFAFLATRESYCYLYLRTLTCRMVHLHTFVSYNIFQHQIAEASFIVFLHDMNIPTQRTVESYFLFLA